MKEEMQKLNELRSTAIKLFVKNDADLTKPNVIAAIVEAAKNMALVSDIASKYDTQDALLTAFNASDNKEVTDLIEMLNPSYIKQIIGFSTDYMDFGSANLAYENQKELYDSLYNQVNNLNNNIKRDL